MITTMTDAIHDLINPWTDVVNTDDTRRPYKAIDHAPLLVTLRAEIRASTGGTAAGATDPAARMPISLEALELWQQITQDVLYLTRKHTKDRPNPMLGYATRHLAERLDALRNTNQITEGDYLHAIRRGKSWRDRIWALLHKPREKELAFCPACEQSKITNTDGEIQAALVAYYAQGTEPTAKCRHCGMEWTGEGQLIILGRMLGANLDTDTLTEMGAM